MIHYKRAKVLATGVNSPTNKGILATATTSTPTVLTLSCLDATGTAVSVVYNITGPASAFIPLYVKSWAATGGAISVWEMN